jgi:cytochrome P450
MRYQTSAGLTAFILAMVLNPEVQRKAQREIDTLSKPGHLPTSDEAENFQYITAVVREVLRWNPIAPLGECYPTSRFLEVFYISLTTALSMADYIGAVRETERDIIYKGYRIPAGSVVLPNTW